MTLERVDDISNEISKFKPKPVTMSKSQKDDLIQNLERNFENQIKNKILENTSLRVQNDKLVKKNARLNSLNNNLVLSLKEICDDLHNQLCLIKKIKILKSSQNDYFNKKGFSESNYFNFFI
jgi:hypothetical protein